MNFGNTQPVGPDIYGAQGINVPITKATTIHELLNVEEKCIAESYAVLEQLAARLESVLRPMQPAPAAAGNTAPQSMQISARITDHTNAVQILASRMHVLLERLEI